MSVLLVVILLSVSNNVISKCPPDSGKSMNVIMIRLLIIGIYLMYNGSCYSNNGSYFKDVAISEGHSSFNYLQCVLPGSTLSGGEWYRSEGGHVNCTRSISSDPLLCITTDTPANLTLYKPKGQGFPASEDQLYKCCLPTSCSDPTYIITAYIYS